MAEPLAPLPPPQTRIVALGASAGGLKPLEAFLAQVPADSGLAYVVVQHLEPTHKALLVELLGRVSALPVCEAEQGMRIAPDHVYVIPPDTELSVAGDTLHLAAPSVRRGLCSGIDVLFSSLARARGEDTIAVLLSGMGSDGTLGLQAVKAAGGLTMAQSLETALFDSMPRSAIAAGCVDVIATPETMPAYIAAIVDGSQKPPTGVAPAGMAPAAPDSQALPRILASLRRRTGRDFTLYKTVSVMRRIERRMRVHGIASLAEYAEWLEGNAQEVDLLFRELLIGMTAFFRDADVWETLAGDVLPELLRVRGEGVQVRAWVVGCSTGEEAYTLAMVLSEALESVPRRRGIRLRIFATDLGPDAIASARRGRYPLSIADSVSPQRLERFFHRHPTHYEIKKSIRDMVLFTQHDVVLDPPFSRLDLITCRNLLVYFDQRLQQRLLPLFHHSLRPGGLLVLGGSESAARFNRLFEPVQPRLRIYRRREGTFAPVPDLPVPPAPSLPASGEARLAPVSDGHDLRIEQVQRAVGNALLQDYAPAAVLLTADGDIVHLSGQTDKYLEPVAGKASWNIYTTAREGLRNRLVDALKQSAQQRERLYVEGLEIAAPGGGRQRLSITVQTFHDDGPLQGMTMVVFQDGAGIPEGASDELTPVPGEMPPDPLEPVRYRDEIQRLRDETHAAQAQLHGANEALRCADEELMAFKEELQSTNEELRAVNGELQAKLDDLLLAQSDIQNVLDNADISFVFLDQHLRLRRFTEQVAAILGLCSNDIGRPLAQLNTCLRYPGMSEDVRETLRTLVPLQRHVRAEDGRRFQVRFTPYRRIDEVIDGVVITLLPIRDGDAPASG